MNSISEAQKDMRDAYYFGVPGIICSGLVWTISGFVALLSVPHHGIIALVFGGMVIFPASVLLCKLLGYSGKHDKTNPLAPLAIEGTIWMLLSIPIAIALATYNQQYFFPAMLLIIAGRYLTFTTLYGRKTFYIFSIVLALFAALIVLTQAPVFSGAMIGGAVELIFALIIYIQARKSKNSSQQDAAGGASA
jgi:hypothetical protein